MNTTLRRVLTGSALTAALLVPSTTALAAPAPLASGAGASADLRTDWYQEGYRHGFNHGWHDARRYCRRGDDYNRHGDYNDYGRGYRNGYEQGFQRAYNLYCH